MNSLKPMIVALVLLAFPATAMGQEAIDIETQDLRLASIADNMLIANARLCRETMPVTGMILHSADQYGSSTPGHFADGPLAIAGVIPDSAAENRGLEKGDTITAINGAMVSAITPAENGHLREAAFFRLADIPPDEPVVLTVKRSGRDETVLIAAQRGCRSLVEILVADAPNARSDGRVIQFQLAFAASLSDENLAVVLAHELAHTVLEHRRRKVEAGIDNASLLRHFGRNQQANRQAEVEADRLSAHLLANAGYDPQLAVWFWRSEDGVRAGGGPMPSWIYPTQAARADLIEGEISRYLRLRAGPSWPGHLLQLRERAFASD